MKQDDGQHLFTSLFRLLERDIIVGHVANCTRVNLARNSLNVDSSASVPNQKVLNMLLSHPLSFHMNSHVRNRKERLFPGHEKQTITIRILQADKSTTPSFVARFGYIQVAIFES